MAVVCLGEALIDLTPSQGTSLQDTSSLSLRIGGAPLNVAVNLKRAGVDTRFVGTLSSDTFGSRIRALLDSECVNYAPHEPVDAPTRLAVINQNSSGPPFTFYGENPADTRLTTQTVNAALVQDVRALYLSSLLMAHRDTANVQMDAMERARAAKHIRVVSDPNPRRSAWPTRPAMLAAVESLLRYSDVTKLSLDDASELGWPDTPETLFPYLRGRTSGAIVITDGANGSWFEDDNGLHHIPPPPVVEIDPTGAGDAFFAAVIHGFLREGRLTANVVETASEAGAQVAGRLGAL